MSMCIITLGTQKNDITKQRLCVGTVGKSLTGHLTVETLSLLVVWV